MQNYDLTDTLEQFMVDGLEDAWLKDRLAKGNCLYTAGYLDAWREIWEKINDKS